MKETYVKCDICGERIKNYGVSPFFWRVSIYNERMKRHRADVCCDCINAIRRAVVEGRRNK